MEANLSVLIGADVSDLKKAIADAIANVDGLSVSVNNTAGEVDKGFDRMAQSAKSLPNAIPKGILGKLEAEFKQLESTIRESTDAIEISNLNKELQRTEAQIRKLNNAGRTGFDDLGNRLDKLPGAAGRANNSLNSLSRGGNQANLALLDLSRVVQDAPFGFIGIANNINPLIDSFTRLRASSKSTGAVLGALGRSLVGAGGLGLAVAGITTAIQIYQNGILGFNSKTKEAKKEADSFKSALQSINSELAKEATRVSVLVDAIKSDTLSKQQRNAAVEELKKINPQYFSQLKDEEGLIKNLSSAYAAYLGSLRNKFAAKALETELERLFDRKLQIEIELDKDAKQRVNNQIQGLTREETKRLQGILSKSLFDRSPEESAFLQRVQQITKKVNVFDYTGETAKSQREIANINKQIDILLFKITELGQTDFKIGKESSDKSQDAAIKQAQEALLQQIAALKLQQLAFSEIRPEYKRLQAEIILLTGQYDALTLSGNRAKLVLAEAAKEALRLTTLQPSKVSPILNFLDSLSIDTSLATKGTGLAEISQQAAQAAQNLRTQYESVANFLTTTLGPAFDNVFQSIFEGNNIFKAIGQSIKAMIAQLIAAIAKAALFAAILSALPGGQAAGGFGSIFKGLLGFKGLAGGGLNGGLAAQLGSSFNGSVSFEISGDKLIGVLNRTNSLRGING